MAIEFRQHILDNGLTIVAEVDPDAHSAAAGFFVRTGARDETPELMGVSHFLEHMMFQGTETRTAEDVDRDFDALGAQHNAFTTSELTAFWAHCLPEALPEAEAILSDILRPSIRPADFDNEKKVILEEIAMYRDQPVMALYEHALESFYDTHTLGHRVLGTEDTVSEMQRDPMAEYFHDRYSADNTVFAMAGRLDFDAMVERVREHCGQWQRTDADRDTTRPATKQGNFTKTDASINRAYLLMLAPAPAQNDDRRYAAGMLAQILGDSDGSRLYWDLIDAGIADEAEVRYDGRDGCGEYLFYASCNPDDADRVTSIIDTTCAKLVDSLTDDDLIRVRSKVATAAALHAERPAGRMRRLGQGWLYQGMYRSLDEELARLDAVTLDELRSVAADFPLRPEMSGRLIPE